MSFVKGENVGAYQIIEQLGQGGMATVFKAYHPALDRYVAIKALHPAFMEEEGFLARFQREAKVVARLDHPNIVPIYDYAEHEGRPYLVMKYVEGETLKARLSRGSLSNSELLDIVEAVGKALSFAHGQGILHRDIKPSNVLLCNDGSIYLADFGLARIAELGASTLSGDMLMGTPHYISPEQARGESDLDERTDVYSFGVVLYELIVGRVPFDSDTPFSIIHDHIYTPLPLPTEINPQVPENIQNFLLKALFKDKEDRFATVGEMVSVFRKAIEGVDIGSLIHEAAPRIRVVPSPASREQVVTPSEVPAIDAQPEEFREAAPSVTPVVQPEEKRRRSWVWLVVGLVFACFSIFIFLGAINRAREGGQPSFRDTTNEQTEFVASQGDSGLTPEEHIGRAEELLSEGQPEAAHSEFFIAGNQFLERGDFIPAVETYLRAYSVSDKPIEEQRQLWESLTEALFLGAHGGDMVPFLESLVEKHPDWFIAKVALARSLLDTERYNESLRWIDEVLRNNPDNMYALAVKAEYNFIHDNVDKGHGIIEELLGRKGLPPWLVDHLNRLKRQF
ncbi:MAG: protein kinase [Anaerolineaceae bacterium]|nr:MAG: protein kinase [Anaerolineaceae bacterium]